MAVSNTHSRKEGWNWFVLRRCCSKGSMANLLIQRLLLRPSGRKALLEEMRF
jgi:hypothetical protein